MTQEEPIPDNLIEAYQKIQEEYPRADVDLQFDLDVMEISATPVIKVVDDIEDSDGWVEKEEEMMDLVREYEGEDDTFYVILDRREDND